MTDQTDSYLRRDLLTLLVLGVIIAGTLAALWYIEQHGGGFSHFAAQLLDAGTH